MTRHQPMHEAMDREVCYFTTDGWCATHSTSAGPVYCEPAPRDDVAPVDTSALPPWPCCGGRGLHTPTCPMFDTPEGT